MRPRALLVKSTVAAAAALLMAACSGGGTPSDSGGGGDNAAKEPVSIAFSNAVPQVQKIPTIQAMQALKEQGHQTELKYLQKSDDPITAVVRGDTKFGSSPAPAVFTAIAKGLPIQAIVEVNRADYAVVAPMSVDSPEGLNGKRVGIHAKVSATTLYTDLMMKTAPKAKPKILVVPGSANRIRALAADQLDASAIQLADLPQLKKLAPNKYHVIYRVYEQNPDLIDSVIFTKTDTIKNDKKLVEQVVKAQVEANRAAYTDTDALAKAISANVPKTTPEQASELAKLYTEANIWPKDGGLTEEGVTTTLNDLVEAGLVEKAPDPAKTYDRGPLEDVLKELG